MATQCSKIEKKVTTKIKKEIDKCKVRCRNCHHIKTHKQFKYLSKIKDIIKEYEEYLQSQRLNVNTIAIYMRTLYEFSSKIGVKQIGKIKQRHFTIFKNSMPNLSEHTVNRKLRALQTFFNWTLDDGYINNAIRIKKLPVVKPPVNFYSDAEFRLILKNVEKGFPHAQAKMIDDDRELFLDAYKLYWNTGMRLSEPFDNELKMDNDGYRLIITGTTTKNSYLRYVHLTEQQAITIIKMNKWLDHQLKSRKNRYETIKLFSRIFAKSLKKSNLMGKFHDLRKTFASKLWFLTGQEFALCYALGHTDTSMTKQYTSLDKVELARAFPDIAALKNGITSDKTPLRGYNQGDIELYSNFGFMAKLS